MTSLPKHNTALMRVALQREAARSYREKRESDAISYSAEALCVEIHRKFDNHSRKLTVNVSLGSLVDEIELTESNEAECYEPAEGFERILQCCRQLPEQWTVFQIHKTYTPRWNQLTHQQLLEEKTSLEIVLFTYPNSELLDGRPVLIRLEPPEDPEFFPLVSSIPVKIKGLLTDEINTGSMRQEEMDTIIGNVINRLAGWLGPWIVLFSGKFSSPKDQQLEAEIFNRVEDFSITNKLSKRDQILISLVARRLDMISMEAIYRFCCEMVRSESQLKELFRFLSVLKESKFGANQSFSCFPCLMIVDELLDSYPWEMMNTNQEFSRLGSFRILRQLYETHKDGIKNGYLRVSAKNCHNIINPDKSLVKMSARLQAFYKQWYPEFKLIVDQPPTDSEFTSILHEADVMIYNGHGSGLQFIDGDTILQHDIKSLIFLFGCDSVRLFPNGLFSEMSGSHLYYNIAKCAAVVGALWVLTDFYTDYYSILLVANWIPTASPSLRDYSVYDLDPTAFKHGTLQLVKKSKLQCRELGDDNLLALMTQFRRRNRLPKRIRCAMVCRGLPVINSTF
ncbi:uncharacterized protein LOC129780260 [Toxorhynchites rutilus septentrionalis]|uniref:uncharacterized protein LOC129780260 n=1 Tax=Toxorhynchites rutilus septentrionalis TaxID=329112 RepID=UPI002478446C|nr:uncharacterized protein LOC129780260 [Toxorhynchites rutilus septentrionalis]